MAQPVGPEVSTTPATVPPREPIHGQYISLVPLQEEHSDSLFRHLGGEDNGHRWTYMFGGPYLDQDEWRSAIQGWRASNDPLAFTVLTGPASDPNSEPIGMMSYMNIVPDHRRLEIGSIIFGEGLKQTKQATEAFYLLIQHALDNLGYLRVEWKANHLNAPSLSAAERLGFVPEGVFRSHMIIKGRRRDTAWFSITQDEWPVAKKAFQEWLSKDNFDQDGKQIRNLKAIRQSLQQESTS